MRRDDFNRRRSCASLARDRGITRVSNLFENPSNGLCSSIDGREELAVLWSAIFILYGLEICPKYSANRKSRIKIPLLLSKEKRSRPQRDEDIYESRTRQKMGFSLQQRVIKNPSYNYRRNIWLQLSPIVLRVYQLQINFRKNTHYSEISVRR